MIDDDVANRVVAPSALKIKEEIKGMAPARAKLYYYGDLEKRLLADMFPSVSSTKFPEDFANVGSNVYKKRQELFKTTPSANSERNKKTFSQRFSTQQTADEYINALRREASKIKS